MFLHWLSVLSVGLLMTLSVSPCSAAEMLPGPYQGTVERVVDGDTMEVKVTVWLQQDIRVLVRIRGIDAPEVRGRCASEKQQARGAALRLASLVAGGRVTLTRIEGDKYFGRVVADVVTPGGEDVAAALLADGAARPYDGAARGSWCEIGAATGGEPTDLARAEAGQRD